LEVSGLPLSFKMLQEADPEATIYPFEPLINFLFTFSTDSCTINFSDPCTAGNIDAQLHTILLSFASGMTPSALIDCPHCEESNSVAGSKS